MRNTDFAATWVMAISLLGCTGNPAPGPPAGEGPLPGATVGADAGPAGVSLDPFGIEEIYPTVAGGREWFATWGDGVARTLESGARDPSDPLFIMRGDGTVSIDGTGTAIVEGPTPRLYVYDEPRKLMWNNVEVTFYGMRVSESGSTLSYWGLVAGARSNHQDAVETADSSGRTPCNGRGYYGKFLYDGRVVFQKEILHHADTGYSVNEPDDSLRFWDTPDRSFPRNEWVGFKLVVRTVDAGTHVALELYRDLDVGRQGGRWEKLIEYVDRGGWTNTALTQAELDNSCPSETHTVDEIILVPGPAVFIRNDNIGEARYRAFSIREIAPGP